MENKKHGASVHRHPLMFNPPPKEDGLKKAKSITADGEGTDFINTSTHQHILIPTRYLGISFCLRQEVS